MHVKVTGGIAAEYTINQLRADNPTIGFPPDPSDKILAEYSVYPAIESPAPSYDPAYQVAAYDFAGSGAVWTQEWTVTVNPSVTDESLREARYGDNQAHSDSLIASAKLSPSAGATKTPRQVKKSDNRRNNYGKQNKQTKVSDADDYLFDWIDSVLDALDQADDSVEDASRAALESWIPSKATWPVWAPYAP